MEGMASILRRMNIKEAEEKKWNTPGRKRAYVGHRDSFTYLRNIYRAAIMY